MPTASTSYSRQRDWPDGYGVGKIAPVSEGTLYLGSNLTLVGTQAAQTTVTMDPGTLVMTKAAINLLVGPYSVLEARTFTEGQVVGVNRQQKGTQAIVIMPNATLWYFGPGQIPNDLPISNRGGLFLISNLARVNLTGGGPTADDFDYSQAEAAARLHIENGSTLTFANKMAMSAGSMYLIMNPNLSAAAQTATISGKVIVSGGDILFSAPITIDTVLTYGTFTVNGDVTWSGGRYLPSIDGTVVGRANKWIVNGTMTSAAACQVVANPLNGAPPANSVWTVMEADVRNGVLPSTPAGSPTLGEFTVGTRKVWRLAT